MTQQLDVAAFQYAVDKELERLIQRMQQVGQSDDALSQIAINNEPHPIAEENQQLPQIDLSSFQSAVEGELLHLIEREQRLGYLDSAVFQSEVIEELLRLTKKKEKSLISKRSSSASSLENIILPNKPSNSSTLRLSEKYKAQVVPALMREFNYNSVIQVPRLSKVALNIVFGDDLHNNKRMVTLRGARMYDFLDRLVNFALPKIRDFRGVSRRSFDGHGNYRLVLREQVIFPEMNDENMNAIRSLEVAIVTTASDDAEGYALLKKLGIPFRD